MSVTGEDALSRIARQAMIDFHLQPDFPKEVEAELSKLETAGSHADVGDPPRDLRNLLWCSIDNDDSRDLDQLSVAQPDGSKLLVAVADVDALVRRGTAIDRHAEVNTTSVYTPAGVFPMLPERLSTDLTSLGQDQARTALVIELTISSEGDVSDAQLYRATVLNRAKLAYRSVSEWLEGRAQPPPALTAVPGLEENIRLQDALTQKMQALRHQRGALNLETGERAPGDRADEGNRAKSLIENLMVAANGATARTLEQRKSPSIRRVLKTPERWDRIVALASVWGDHLPPAPDARALEQFLERQRAKNPARYPELSLGVLKLLGRGEYALHRAGTPSPGHFGLAVQDYTHATAPNRRFADLVTHRLLKAALEGKAPPYDDAELTRIATHCTDQESNATKVERRVRKSAAALTLVSRVGERFAAVVTGASGKGTWVRILRPFAEGKLIEGSSGLDVGDRLEVELRRADPPKGLIDFAAVHTHPVA